MNLTNRLVFAALLFVSLAAYSNSFHTPFIFDDRHTIIGNYGLRDLGNLKEVFTSDSPGRPFLYLTFALNYAVGGLDTFGYHVVNFLLHFGTAWLVFLIAADLFRREGVENRVYPAFVAIIFAVHPLNVEAVTYISSRSTVMATFFYFLSFRLITLSGFRFNKLYAAGFVAFLLGVFTKEIAITLPALLTIFVYQYEGANGLKKARRPLYMAWLVLPLIFAYRTIMMGHPVEQTAERNLNFFNYFLTQLYVVALEYIPRILVPLKQVFEADVRIKNSPFDIQVILGATLLAFMAWFAIKNFRKKKLLSFSILWFLTVLSVTSSFLPILDTYIERRLYIAIPAFYMGVVYLFYLLCQKMPNGWKPLLACAVAVVVVFGTLTYKRNHLFTSRLLIWEDSASKTVAKARVYSGLALAYMRMQKLDKAESTFKFAIKAFPDFVLLKLGYCFLLGAEGRWGDLERLLDTIKPVTPLERSDFMHYRAVLAAEKGDIELAKHLFKQSHIIKPDYLDGTLNYSSFLWRIGEKDNALRVLRDSAQRYPRVVAYHLKLSVLLKEIDKVESIKEYQRALELSPYR